MTPTALVDLAEAKELMKLRQFRKALEKLNNLTNSYPMDQEIQRLIRICQDESQKYTVRNTSKVYAQEVIVTFRSPARLAFTLFFIIIGAIIFSTFLMYVIGQILRYTF